MKHILFRSLTALVLMLCAIPMMSQDCMEIFFSDGSSRKFFLRAVTEIFTSDYYNGVRRNTPDFQYVVTQDNEYVYDIATIDSITFTKFDEEKIDKTIRSAFEVINPVLDECETTEQAEQRIDEIKNAEGVEKAWTDDHHLYVKIKDWECIPFHFGYADDDDGDEAVRAVAATMEIALESASMARPPKKVTVNPEQKDRKLSFVIANVNHYNTMGKYETYTNERILPVFHELQNHSALIDVTYDPTPSVDFFKKDMFSKDVVWLITHGGYNKEGPGHYIFTGECLGRSDRWFRDPTDEEKAVWKEKVDSIRLKHGIESEMNLAFGFVRENRGDGKHWYAYATIGENFFEDNCDAEYIHHNTILFNTSCQSIKGDTDDESLSLVEKLKTKGLGIYLGFNNSSSHGPRAGQSFFSSMLKGNSALKAFNTMPVIIRFDVIDQSDLLQRALNYEGSKADLFLLPVYTLQLPDDQATTNVHNSGYVEVEALTTSIDPNELKFGFIFGGDEALTNGQSFETNDVMKFTSSVDKGNVKFRIKVKGFKPGYKYYYCAYTYDGQGYNYGNTCSFAVGEKPEEPIVEEDRYLMTIGRDTETSTSYSVTKQMIDRKDFHENADGWKFYRTLLTFDVNRNGSTTTYTLDDNIYMEDGYSSNSAQNAAMLIDLKNNNIYVFCISKDGNGNYTMDGYCYVASLNDFNFRRETVFSGKNWGWYPYFVESADGLPTVAHFSYAGYYAVFSIRYDANNWESVSGNKIKPDEFQNISQQNGLVLIVRDNDSGNEPTGYTSCPDGNHPHPIDLGLPSGTKWSCCNVGASEPEDYGGYYAWGETLEKDDYSSYSYTVDADVLDVGGTEMDVAHVQWGGNWQMPTRGQIDELLDNCEMSDMVVKANGVTGVELTSKKGVKIFLPASGYKDGNKLNGKGQHGCYMSANRNPANNSNLFSGMSFGAYSRWRYFRYHGDNVRAVWNK